MPARSKGLLAMRLRVLLTAGLVGAILAGCSTSQDRPDIPPAPLGQAADLPVSCTSLQMNALAMVPGSAAGSVGAGDSDSSALNIGLTIAGGINAYINGNDSLVGWGLDELLGSGSSGGGVSPELANELSTLSSQLGTITNSLNTIEGDLASTINLIKDSTYQDQIAQLTQDHISPMLSMWQSYCQIVSSKDTTASTLNELTSSVLDPSVGMRAHLTAIVDAFEGDSTIGEIPLAGMFATFVVDQGVPDFDDRPVYKQKLDSYRDYFVNLVVMGMTLLIEAQHATGDVTGAQETLKEVWSEVRQVYQAGGAPVTDNNVVVHIPSRKVWTRQPLCPTSQLSSDSIIGGANGSSSPVQDAINDSVMDAWTISNNGGGGPVPPPDYEFAAGEPVCSLSWDTPNGEPTPSSWLADAIAASPIASNAMNTGSDPTSVWRDPTLTDYKALVADRGADSAVSYLTQNGFALPPSGEADFVPQLAYGFWKSSGSGWYDISAGTSTCLGSAAGCAPSVFTSFMLVSDSPCMTGAGSYPGLPTACGTGWIDALWPVSPPPPAATATATAGTATISAAPTSNP